MAVVVNRCVRCVVGFGWFVGGCGGLDTWAAASAGTCSAASRGLQITELLPLPVGQAAGRQWLELCNEGNEPIELGGLELEIGSPWLLRRATLPAQPPLAPGAYRLLGDATRAARQRVAGWPVDVTYGDLPLASPVGEVRLRCGDQLVAQLRYGPGTDVPAPQVGRALAKDVSASGVVSWCSVAGPLYDGYDQGSPGRPHPGCSLCQSGNGWRRQRLPVPHALTVEAVQADPDGHDRGREWLRLRAGADGPIDLQGLQMWADVPGKKRRAWRLVSPTCSPLLPGESRTLQVGVEAKKKPPTTPYWAGPTLPNRAMWLTVLAADGTVVDQFWLPFLPHHAGVRRLPTLRQP